MRTGRHFLRAALIVVALASCGASPPIVDGTAFRAGLGYGQYEFLSGCDEPYVLHRANELRVHLAGEYFWKKSGFNFVGELFLDYSASRPVGVVEDGVIREDSVAGRRDNRLGFPYLTLRGGWHGTYGGGELGVLFFAIYPFLSANVWLGHRTLHAWASLNSEPIRWRQRKRSPLHPISVGLGHVSDRFEGSLGLMQDGGVLELHTRLSEPIWLGTRVNLQDARNWGAIMYVGLRGL